MSLTQNDKLPHKASIIQYCDTQRNPIAVEQKPRLSWRIADVPDGYMQTAYRIRVASCREKLAEADVWCSGDVLSDLCVDIELPATLQSSTRYWWAVDVRNQDGIMYSSQGDWFETGLLHQADWKGQ